MTHAVFDDPNLVSAAGLVPAMRLAESAGFYDLLQGLSVPSANAGVKAASVVAGMLAGADSIRDLDLLRHGGMSRLFTNVRAPSTPGTFAREAAQTRSDSWARSFTPTRTYSFNRMTTTAIMRL